MKSESEVDISNTKNIERIKSSVKQEIYENIQRKERESVYKMPYD